MGQGGGNKNKRGNKREIGRAEFFSLSLALCMGGPLLWGTLEKGLGSGFWPALLAAGLAGLVWPLLLLLWGRLFAGLSFGEALCYSLGRSAGRVALFIYGGFWLALAWCAVDCGVEIWRSLGAVSAPLWLYRLSLAFAAAAFAWAGGVSLARGALLVVCPALLLALANMGLTVFGADFGNLRPGPAPGELGELALYGLVISVPAFGGLSALLPVLEQVEGAKLRWREGARGELAATIVWAAVGVVTLAVLGESVGLYDCTLLQVFRLAEVGHWFSRFEVIGAQLLLTLVLIRAAALLAGALDCLCQLWRWPNRSGRSRGVLAVCLGLAVSVSLGKGFLSEANEADTGWLWGFTVGLGIGLPLLAVLMGALRLRRESRTVIVNHEKN